MLGFPYRFSGLHFIQDVLQLMRIDSRVEPPQKMAEVEQSCLTTQSTHKPELV